MSKSRSLPPYLSGTLIALAIGGVFLAFKKKVFGGVKADNWSKDPNYFTTTNGVNLSALGKKVGITLSRNKGLNGSGYSKAKYDSFKNNPKVHWAIYDISGDSLIASSKNGRENIYGASVPKICVASACLTKNGGKLPTDADYEKMIRLLVVSDNNAWTPIQDLAGGGAYVNSWAKSMGYSFQPARGMGNNVNAVDMCKFYRDVLTNRFAGADVIYKISSSCQTDSTRGRKYMPNTVYMGGKTGTYMSSNHNCCWIQKGDRFYSICVLTDLGANGSDAIAQVFRGLYDEYL